MFAQIPLWLLKKKNKRITTDRHHKRDNTDKMMLCRRPVTIWDTWTMALNLHVYRVRFIMGSIITFLFLSPVLNDYIHFNNERFRHSDLLPRPLNSVARPFEFAIGHFCQNVLVVSQSSIILPMQPKSKLRHPCVIWMASSLTLTHYP